MAEPLPLAGMAQRLVDPFRYATSSASGRGFLALVVGLLLFGPLLLRLAYRADTGRTVSVSATTARDSWETVPRATRWR